MIPTRRSTRQAESTRKAGRKRKPVTTVPSSIAQEMVKDVTIRVLDLSKVIDFSAHGSLAKTYSASAIAQKVAQFTITTTTIKTPSSSETETSLEDTSSSSNDSSVSTQPTDDIQETRFDIENLSLHSLTPSPSPSPSSSSSTSSSASLTSSELYELMCYSNGGPDQMQIVDQQPPIQSEDDLTTQNCLKELGPLLNDNLFYDIASS